MTPSNKFNPIKKAQIRTIYGCRTLRTELKHPTEPMIWKYYEASWYERSIPGKNPDDCYTWIGSFHRQGYGMFNVRRTNDDAKSGQMNAQRIAKAIELGRPLIREENVYATCNNLSCTNVKHLKIGTHQEATKRSPAWKKRSSMTKAKKIVVTELEVKINESKNAKLLELYEKFKKKDK